jgi:hypothetical protein
MPFGVHAGSSRDGIEAPIYVGFHVPWNDRENRASPLKQPASCTIAPRVGGCYLEDEESSGFAAGSSSEGALLRREEKKFFSLYQ